MTLFRYTLVLAGSFAVMTVVLAAEKANPLQGYKVFEATLAGSARPITVFAKDYFDAKDQIQAQFCQGRDFNSCVVSGPSEKH